MQAEKTSISRVIKSMGLVFGDIGTSPIYTFTVIFLTLSINYTNVISVLSLIIWTLLLVVTAQYAWLAMSLSKKGEGGSIVLNEIFKKLIKSSKATLFFSFLTYVGISLLIGDSAITPAMSILSAVEGSKLIEPLQNISQNWIIVLTLIITIALFSIQKKGTEKISQVFGPIMLIWFIFLGTSGIISILHMPSIIAAINPLNGINFLLHNGFAGFFVLSEVILCATGAEALYADMGHLGRKPITYAWGFVLCTLLLNYLGQGAFLLAHPNSHNILFSMILSLNPVLYIPFLILSIMATIIASQAMISGLYSIVYQGINTRIMPLFKVDYTSAKINSQIYIGSANWFLLLAVILIILLFKNSANLASAYGLAVTGTITITGVMISAIFFLRKKYFQFSVAILLLGLDICFLLATSSKFLNGAYWSIIIASIPFVIIVLYIKGNQALYKSMVFMPINVFIKKYLSLRSNLPTINGTALFFTRGMDKIPPYIINTIFMNNIIYSKNIFVQINKTNEAFGISHEMTDIAEGLKFLKIHVGYMQVFKFTTLFKQLNINEKVIFYGIEDIETNNPLWHAFSFIKKITPTFVSFYNLPTHKIHGVVTQIKLK